MYKSHEQFMKRNTYMIPKLTAPSRAFTEVSGNSAPALEADLATLYVDIYVNKYTY
jgi:hypothetical protein